jgi:pimeloyl-ACP methyl ester carboxylesterase
MNGTRFSTRLLLVLGSFVVLLAAGFAAIGAGYRPNTDIPAGAAGRHVVVRGVPLRVLQRGSGRDILLIHGSPGSLEDWAPVIDDLAQSYRVTAFDRPGHGYSGDAGAYSLAYNAQTVIDLMDVLGLEHVVVVGHSYGGATALAVALQAPPSAAAYVIVDSASYKSARKPEAIYSLLEMPYVGMGVATVLGARVAPKRIRKVLLELFRAHPPSEAFIAQRIRMWSTPKVTHAIAMETLGAQASLDAQSPSYPQIRQPVQILGQAEDPMRTATAQRLHAAIAGSTLHLIAGTGHYIQFEKTGDVLAAIRSALASSPL